MNLKYHTSISGLKTAELPSGSDIINDPDDILSIIAEASYHHCNKIIIYANCLNSDFFNLKTGLAGEVLQKFSNYRMKLSIVGDFSGYQSKSLKDFIRESNNRGVITFVDSLEKALA